MIALTFNSPTAIAGARVADLDALFPGTDRVRQVERASIRLFMERHQQYLVGKVLDYGAGRQPYRSLVAGTYVPYEKADGGPPLGPFDAVMCNQVIQYADEPASFLHVLHAKLRAGGYLLLTYPVNWDEVEGEDLWRFTKAGMERLLMLVGFQVIVHERRAEVRLPGCVFPLGYGVVCRRADVRPA